MKNERIIDRIKNRVVVTAFGRVGFAQFKTVFDEMLDQPDFRANMDILWDLTDATIEASVIDVQRIVRHIYKNRTRRGSNYKTAIIAVGTTELAASNLFGILASYLPFDTKDFEGIQAAEQWLDKPIS